MTKISYHCKFCRRPGVAEYDEGMVRDVSKWATMLACDPCGDFMDSKRRLKDIFRSIGYRLTTARLTRSKKLDEVEAESRKRFAEASRTFAALVCSYYRCALIWEPEFVEQLIDAPNRTDHIAEFYFRSVPKMIEK